MDSPSRKTIVTSYENPDLDGTACAIAYAELLQHQGYDALASVFNEPHREAQFVLKSFSLIPPEDGDRMLMPDDDIVLVDASDTWAISDHINPAKVIEVIDHPIVNEAKKFPFATIQIELVGSCATLIAERLSI